MKTTKHANETREFLVDRMLNTTQTAEGAIVPPQQKASVRVPIVRQLRILKQESFFGGTTFTVGWQSPDEPNLTIAQYNVWVYGLLSNSGIPVGPYSVSDSPSIVRLTAELATRVSFVVQTQLSSGLVSPLSLSPSCTGIVNSAGLIAADIPNNSIAISKIQISTPNNIFSWDGAGNPASRSRANLDLVLGNANLSDVGAGVTVSAAGTLTEISGVNNDILAFDGSNNLDNRTRAALDLVLGNANLTTVGSVPYVSAAGILNQDATQLFWDATNNRFGVGTNTPGFELDVVGTTRTQGFYTNIRTISVNSSQVESDYTVLVDSTSGDRTYTLSASPTTGKILALKKLVAANNMIIDGNGNNIDGAATITEPTQYKCYTIQFDGNDWFIISETP